MELPEDYLFGNKMQDAKFFQIIGKLEEEIKAIKLRLDKIEAKQHFLRCNDE